MILPVNSSTERTSTRLNFSGWVMTFITWSRNARIELSAALALYAALVKTGGSNKTISCAICHGDSLEGLGDVPRIAGLHPAYVARQLYAFQTGTNHSVSSALMKKVVANLTADDILAIAAYAAAQ